MGFSPCMAKPGRNATPNQILSSSRTFFVTTKTSMGGALLQSERNAMLFIDVLRSYVKARKFQVHDFVVMPDHVHFLITIEGEMSIEKAVQFIKGGFSFRLRKETGYAGEVWQRGFSETRVNDPQSYENRREYIAQNPVIAGLVDSPEEYSLCFTALTKARDSRTGTRPEQLSPNLESSQP
jgi:putative transposase